MRRPRELGSRGRSHRSAKRARGRIPNAAYQTIMGNFFRPDTKRGSESDPSEAAVRA